MEICIRPINIDDYHDFFVIAHKETYRLTFQDEIPKEFLLQEFDRTRNNSISNEKSVVGAFFGEEIVGLAIHEVRADSDKHEYGWIHFYYVSQDFRRLGVGTELVRYSKEYFKRLGFKEFCLRTGEFNTNAQAFYLKIGFKHDTNEDKASLGGVTEYFMRYDIT